MKFRRRLHPQGATLVANAPGCRGEKRPDEALTVSDSSVKVKTHLGPWRNWERARMAFWRLRVRSPSAPLTALDLVVCCPANPLRLTVLRRIDAQGTPGVSRLLDGNQVTLLHFRAVDAEQVHLACVALADTAPLLTP